ncbi:MAG: RIP metalloprotease RseP [Candidatus Moranbacteria bacterium CG23_combo_of_CG06-09_8_20_14_all_39_10]|nr:MAG: RIP metalloprotease RseP [Candidatus Moranbacteria bacterium CG23_combo_of_CG06-09_8_20_14_all_39_10]
MLTAIIFIAILGVLIFVHELGHFVTARRNGVKADEFGFGFPPRLAGFVRDEKTGKFEFVWGNKEIESKHTVYSINWIPLGGFVRIKGEDGNGTKDLDSFASKKAWPRIKILAAGVIMNFIFAWILISIGFIIGAPETIESNDVNIANAKIQISEVLPDSPADKAGIKIGDEILKENKQTSFAGVTDVQNYINSNKGKAIDFNVLRGSDIVEIKVVPRENAPAGQGAIGIALAQTVIKRYPVHEALWNGAIAVYNLTIAILLALGGIIMKLFAGNGVGAEVSGPIGIAILTKQVATLGLVYVLQFAALLSINLGIINALPIPALDGGRILFILIEKIKGSPVTQKTEQLFHTIGFVLLMLLMVLVTLRDVLKIIH